MNEIKSIIQKILLLSLFSMLFFYSGCSKGRTYDKFKNDTFIELRKIRETKSLKIQKWLIGNKNLLMQENIRNDLISYFEKMHNNYYNDFNKTFFLSTNNEIEEFFFYNLGNFYDLLFVNSDGQIFYSVKLEDDFQTNLFSGIYSNTLLADKIQECKNDTDFIDFEYYPPSQEAASFYVFPVSITGNKGWIIAQLSINHLNNLLIDRKNLGETGEVYLVNEQQLLLTESRFINVDSVLSKKIDTEAIYNRKGFFDSDVIDDYRNVKVLSSYKTFQFDKSNWKLIVEKDEAEVITDYFRINKRNIFPLLVEGIKNQTENRLDQDQPLELSNTNAKVDVGEIIRSNGKKPLLTYGVSTCTAISAYAKDMDFVYMAHLTPLDLSYKSTGFEKGNWDDKLSDLTSVMIRKILYFEVKSCQIKNLEFIITVTHEESLMNIIEILLGQGIFLSQIKVGLLENTKSVDLYCSNQTAISIWNRSSGVMFLDYNKIDNLGEFVKNL
ncbi:MAG: hypothetical protein GY756_20335 [bacterium]|nr:hypothetical protein [bacterium]